MTEATGDAEWWQRFVRSVDLDAVRDGSPEERISAVLIERDEPRAAGVRLIKTPVGGGSPRGAHTHPFEQVFFILQGTMDIEILGRHRTLAPGDLVAFPAGVEHRNWNASDGPTVHLAIDIPVEDRS